MDSPPSSISSHEHQVRYGSAPVSSYEPAGMTTVRDIYKDVQDTLTGFNDKVSNVLSIAEDDFLKAYRTHMQVVYQEISYLKSKLAEAEDSIQYDEQIQSLEADCNFYKSESNRIETSMNAMKKEIVLLKGKHAALKREREVLFKKLRACKKQERLLSSDFEEQEKMIAMERRVGDAVSSVTSLTSKARKYHGSQKMTTLEKSRHKKNHTCNKKGTKNLLFTAGDESSEPERRSGTMELPMLTVPWNLDSPQDEIPSEPEVEEDTFLTKQQERALSKELAEFRTYTANLRSLVVAYQTRRTDLEDFYILCVEDIKKSEYRRQRKGVDLKSTSQRMGEIESLGQNKEEVLIILFNELFREF